VRDTRLAEAADPSAGAVGRRAGRHAPSRLGGGTYEDLASHTITARIFGRETKILDLPWLIRVKRAAGRPRDLEVIAELEALQDESVRRDES
jgi:hypothetical protein